MALSANTANVQILVDDAKHTVVKLLLHQTSGDESDVLKVNVATLAGRTLILNTNNTNTNVPHRSFVMGENITGGTSGAVGFVIDHNKTAQTVTIGVSTGTFSGTEVVTGATSGHSETLLSITTPTYILDIIEAWWSVCANTAKVELSFDNGGTKLPVMFLHGNGSYSRNTVGTKVKNEVATPNGNLYVTTYGGLANGGYSIVLTLRKARGFASRPV